MFPFSREILSPEQKSNVTSSPQVFNAQFYHACRPFPLDPQHITAYMVNCKTCTPGKYIGNRVSDQLYGDFITVNMYTIGGERNMKQRIPTNSITSKLVLKSMYASCSTGPFFADHYSHRFEKTQLKFRQEK